MLTGPFYFEQSDVTLAGVRLHDFWRKSTRDSLFSDPRFVSGFRGPPKPRLVLYSLSFLYKALPAESTLNALSQVSSPFSHPAPADRPRSRSKASRRRLARLRDGVGRGP